MMKRKKPILEIIYVVFLVTAIILLFSWFKLQNSKVIKEQNRTYASDSAQMKAIQVDNELNNALSRINTYAYFVGEGLTEPVITAQMLENMERNSQFDAIMFTDFAGTDYASDGRTSDVTKRHFYNDGIKGNSNIEVIFDPHFFKETMMCVYSPVYYEEQVIGVLRGAFLAEKYLKNMLGTTYFGEEAQVFLCAPDGRVIAHSDNSTYEGHLIDAMLDTDMIDEATAGQARQVFENGGEGAFICDSTSKTDNICVTYLLQNKYVLVQTFPKKVTQNMITKKNLIGIQLEGGLILLFGIYIIIILIRARLKRKELEKENLDMGYIISGVNTLFSRFALVDFEEDTYRYMAGTAPEIKGIVDSGRYQDLVVYLASSVEESIRQEFLDFMDKRSISVAMSERNDLRYECCVIRDGHPVWEHINIICLERRHNKASKVLLIRQNVTELKEREWRIQAERSLANRKESQYQLAIKSSSFCSFDFNLTRDLVEQDIIGFIDGRKISFLELVGLEAPCKASEFFEKFKQFIMTEYIENYSSAVK